jgi:hypothetical protein
MALPPLITTPRDDRHGSELGNIIRRDEFIDDMASRSVYGREPTPN